jgi:uncharacterized protein YlxW (UPF0749 family)
MFQTLKSIVPYGKTTPLTTDKLTSCVKVATDELGESNEQLADELKHLEFMKSAQLSREELEQVYGDYQSTVDEINDSIDEIQMAIAEMRTIIGMVDCSEYYEDGLNYYLAYECDPNHPETE